MKQFATRPQSGQHGVVLVEAMVAILLFSVGILAIAGLQATMLQNTSEAKYRAQASYAAQQTIGKMWANPANTYAGVYNVATPISDLPNGILTVNQAALNGPYLITVTWQQPGQDPHTFSTSATITPCLLGIATPYVPC
ncbi:MAG: type IV pilus modification protein PilV [Nitrosomonadales bacterium]|nr:type IV pilus modification protein PilV [Nitrosomonadales bacterium]